MKPFSTHFTDSFLVEGAVGKIEDFFSRKNKSTIISKIDAGELQLMSGEKVGAKNPSEWSKLKSELESAQGPDDLPSDWSRRFNSAVISRSKIDKIANGLSTMSGKDPSGEDWEAGISVALDILAGRNYQETAEWERFGKYWSDWEDQAMETARQFQKLKVTQLKQTGNLGDAKLTKEWRGGNRTPKTDLMDQSGKMRISLKKAGGSQLMSGLKDETVSTVEAAMKSYSLSNKGKKNFDGLLKSIEDNMFKMTEKGSISQIRDYAKLPNPTPAQKKALEEVEMGDEMSKQLNADLEQYINNDIIFKSHFCWEAATGHGKFGQDTWPTANIIITFKGTGGIQYTQKLESPEVDGKAIAKGNNFYVSFKSSGGARASLAMRTKNIPKSKQLEDYIPTFAEIVTEEAYNSGMFLTEDIQRLDEYALLNKLKKGAQGISAKVAGVAKKALDAIKAKMKKAFGAIKRLGQNMWFGLLNFLGLGVKNVSINGGGKFPLEMLYSK